MITQQIDDRLLFANIALHYEERDGIYYLDKLGFAIEVEQSTSVISGDDYEWMANYRTANNDGWVLIAEGCTSLDEAKDCVKKWLCSCISSLIVKYKDTNPLTLPVENLQTFQSRVQPWMLTCFGQEISMDTGERNHRFLEESLELVQSCGCTQSEAHQLVDYVFGRPVGDKPQEVGGVMVTLAALCLANAMDMHDCGEVELSRIWTKVEQIRAKQAAKPKHSPCAE